MLLCDLYSRLVIHRRIPVCSDENVYHCENHSGTNKTKKITSKCEEIKNEFGRDKLILLCSEFVQIHG